MMQHRYYLKHYDVNVQMNEYFMSLDEAISGHESSPCLISNPTMRSKYIKKIYQTHKIQAMCSRVEIGHHCGERSLQKFACNFNISHLSQIDRIEYIHADKLVDTYYPRAGRLFRSYTGEVNNISLPDIPLDPYRMTTLNIIMKDGIIIKDGDKLRISYDIYEDERTHYPRYGLIYSGLRDMETNITLYNHGKIMGLYICHELEADKLSGFIKDITMTIGHKHVIHINSDLLHTFEHTFGNGIIPLMRKSRDVAAHAAALDASITLSIKLTYKDKIKPRTIPCNGVHIYAMYYSPVTLCADKGGNNYWNFTSVSSSS